MTDPMDTCDYCHENGANYIRIIGWIDHNGSRLPQVKLWCRQCEPDDECDPEATAHFLNHIKAKDTDHD